MPHRYGKVTCHMKSQCYLPPGRKKSRLYTKSKQVLDLATPEGCKAELTYVT